MRKRIKVFVIYFPVILVACQVLVNLVSFVLPDLYIKAGFILNTLFGVNALFALFLLSFTYRFKFCAVSRYSAWAEVLFAFNFLIVQQDNLYNIMFQVIVGSLALVLTVRHFVYKFPLCSLSLVLLFIKSAGSAKSCTKGMEIWEQKTYKTIQARYENRT